MSRASFGGTLTIGSIGLSIQAYPVAKEEKDPAPKWLHKKDRGPLREGEPRCTLCGEMITEDEQIRGVATPKGYVLLEEDELKQIKPEKDEDSSIVVTQFMPLDQVDPRWAQKSYYLAPRGPEHIRPLALLTRAMRAEKVAGVVTYISYGSHRLGIIETAPTGLILTTLYFASEIREISDYGIDIDPIPLTKEEIDLAQRVVKSRTAHFTHTAYPDHGRNLLLALIEAKSKKQKFVAPALDKPLPPKVVALLDALKASIAKKGTLKMPSTPAAKRARG